MWMVELNVLGHRFTHQVPDRRRTFRFSPRAVQTRLSAMRHSRAAA